MFLQGISIFYLISCIITALIQPDFNFYLYLNNVFEFPSVLSSAISVLHFVLRKKGSKTKERMKEEEIEKGDCGPPTRKVFF